MIKISLNKIPRKLLIPLIIIKIMKIISWNVNGIRAVLKKGFMDFIKKEKPDIICIQETKARPEQVDHGLEGYFNIGIQLKRRVILVLQFLLKKNLVMLIMVYLFLIMIKKAECAL